MPERNKRRGELTLLPPFVICPVLAFLFSLHMLRALLLVSAPDFLRVLHDVLHSAPGNRHPYELDSRLGTLGGPPHGLPHRSSPGSISGGRTLPRTQRHIGRIYQRSQVAVPPYAPSSGIWSRLPSFSVPGRRDNTRLGDRPQRSLRTGGRRGGGLRWTSYHLKSSFSSLRLS